MATQPDPKEQMKQLQQAMKGGAQFIVLGLFFLVIGAGHHLYNRYLFGSREKTSGYVTSIGTETFSKKGSAETTEETVTTFQFYAGGEPQSLKETTNWYKQGESVEILFDPTNPKEAILAPSFTLDYLLLGGALAIVLFGLFKSWRAKKSA